MICGWRSAPILDRLVGEREGLREHSCSSARTSPCVSGCAEPAFFLRVDPPISPVAVDCSVIYGVHVCTGCVSRSRSVISNSGCFTPLHIGKLWGRRWDSNLTQSLGVDANDDAPSDVGLSRQVEFWTRTGSKTRHVDREWRGTGHPNPCKLADERSAGFWNRTALVSP